MVRAVFLSCSGRKVPGGKPVPAIDRYDGPCFRVLRRYLRTSGHDRTQAWIVSAKHGLISGTDRIHDYDTPMTTQRANELREDTAERFWRLWRKTPFEQAFASLSSNYALAMQDCWPMLPENLRVTFAEGAIGCRCSLLKAWLRGYPETAGADACITAATPMLLGVPVSVSGKQALALAARWIETESGQAGAFQTWYVPLQGRRVAVKWFVSNLTGLPVSRFRTADALRVLRALGIQCCPTWAAIPDHRKGATDE